MKTLHLIITSSLALLLISCSGDIITRGLDSPDYQDTRIAILLESASNQLYGYGTFGNPPRTLENDNSEDLVEGKDYIYDKALDNSDSQGYNIYDKNTSQYFDTGKFFRIVENGKNAADPTGLNFTPIAKNLSSIISPPNNQIYIDPARGIFVLPRPVYWSRLDHDWNSVTSPEIGSQILGNSTYTNTGPVFAGFNTTSGYYMFTSALGMFRSGGGGSGSIATIYPFGTSFTAFGNGLDKGTISVWWMGWAYYHIFIMADPGNNGVIIQFADTNYIYSNSSAIASSSNYSWVSQQWHHIYIVWDKDGIEGSIDTIKLYHNGNLDMSSTDSIDSLLSVPFCIGMNGDGGSPVALYIDNIKIWNDTIDNPDWEYNDGNGREDALHVIYSSENGYKPVLDLEHNSGVGYYH